MPLATTSSADLSPSDLPPSDSDTGPEQPSDSEHPAHMYSSDDGFISGEGILSPKHRASSDKHTPEAAGTPQLDAGHAALTVVESVINKLQESCDGPLQEGKQRMLADHLSEVNFLVCLM